MKSFIKKTLIAAGAVAMIAGSAHATTVTKIGKVWVIAMENRNFSQPSTETYGVAIYGNTQDAPYINKLIGLNGTTAPTVTLHDNTTISPTAHVSWASAYHSVLAIPSGAPSSIHPSEPNYVWSEAGSNLSILNDNDPYAASSPSVQAIQNYLTANPSVSGVNLRAVLQNAGVSWRSYQEGTGLLNSNGVDFNSNGGTLTNNVASLSQRTVPLASFSGTSASYVNPYNGTHQYNFATKHEGALFFPATNGSTTTTANKSNSNPFVPFYAPLEQLDTDLTNGTCARYNWITPDQYNDMHTALSGGTFTYNGTTYSSAQGDRSQVAQGDNFLSKIVPKIMASADYQNGGAIIIWTDETEGTNRDDYSHTLLEIVISPLAKGNAYKSTLNYTHSTDINTFQKIFQVASNTPTGYINDAANPSNTTGSATSTDNTADAKTLAATPGAPGGGALGYGTGIASDLSDLFVSGTIPTSIPATKITKSGYTTNPRTHVVTQTITVTNQLPNAISTPLYLALDNLSSNTTLSNSAGTVQDPANAPVGSPYVLVSGTGLAIGASATVTLQFTQPSSGTITADLRVIATSSAP